MCGDVCVCVYYDLNIFDVCFFRVQVFKKIFGEGMQVSRHSVFLIYVLIIRA